MGFACELLHGYSKQYRMMKPQVRLSLRRHHSQSGDGGRLNQYLSLNRMSDILHLSQLAYLFSFPQLSHSLQKGCGYIPDIFLHFLHQFFWKNHVYTKPHVILRPL